MRDRDGTLRTVMKCAWSVEQRPLPGVPVEFGVGVVPGAHGVWFLPLQLVLRRTCTYLAFCCQTEVSICYSLNKICDSVVNVPLTRLTSIYLVCFLYDGVRRSGDG